MPETKKSPRPPVWEREEVVILVCEYYRTRNSSNRNKEESIEKISRILRQRAKHKGMEIDDRYRNIAGIRMKFGNLKALDKDVLESGKSGLKSFSKLDSAVVSEYIQDPEKICKEAYCAVMKYV